MAKPFKIILLIIAAMVVMGGALWFAYLRRANGPSQPTEQPKSQEEEQNIVSEEATKAEEDKSGEIEWSGDEISNELDFLDEVSE